MIQKEIHHPLKEYLHTNFRHVAIIGTGQMGNFFNEQLSAFPLEHVSMVSHHQHEYLQTIMSREPNAIILATPNPVKEMVEEIVEYKKPTNKNLLLILPQNGTGVIEQAQEVINNSQSKDHIQLLRCNPYTTVDTEDGKIKYNQKKLRMTLASPSGNLQNAELLRTSLLFELLGFTVKTYEDYRAMELTKVLINTLGSTSTITGLRPSETFRDPRLFAIELRGLQDRLSVIKASGVPTVNVPWAKLPLIRVASSILPEQSSGFVRSLVAMSIAGGRNDLPSAAGRKIMRGGDGSEAKLYHLPFIQLGKEHGNIMSVDRAVVQLLFEQNSRNIDLPSMDVEQRIELLVHEVHDQGIML